MQLDLYPDFFVGSQVTTRFGWDKNPPGPRIHPAIDRAGPGLVRIPVEATKSQWIDDDAEGCSVLRLFFDGGELRMLHFIRAEIDKATLELALAHRPISMGATIGKTGNHGLSVSQNGGSGRHVHYSLILEPGKYDDALESSLGPGWKDDQRAAMRKANGQVFDDQVKKRGIQWMNENIIARKDPYYNFALRYYVNTAPLGL